MPWLSPAPTSNRSSAPRQLDRTLTTALPPLDPRDEYAARRRPASQPWTPGSAAGCRAASCPSSSAPRSSGRTSLLLRMLAAATARGELVALVDALDMFDVESAAAAGVDLDRLLWIRGHVVTNPGMCRDMNQRAMEQAIRALTLVLQAGNFGLVALRRRRSAGRRAAAAAVHDLAAAAADGRRTARRSACWSGSEPMARSSAGLTLQAGQASADWSRVRDARSTAIGCSTGSSVDARDRARAGARAHERVAAPWLTRDARRLNRAHSARPRCVHCRAVSMSCIAVPMHRCRRSAPAAC